MPPENKPQRQDSLLDQLRDLVHVARREGMYDASDYLQKIVERQDQAISFAYGNATMHNPDVTREVVKKQAEKLMVEKVTSGS